MINVDPMPLSPHESRADQYGGQTSHEVARDNAKWCQMILGRMAAGEKLSPLLWAIIMGCAMDIRERRFFLD